MFIRSKHHGQALALIMVAIFGIIALTALAIDGGNAFGDKRKAQSAADNAALSAALALTDKISATVYTTEALKITQANSRPDDTVTVSYPPGAGCDGIAFSYAGLYDPDPTHYVQVMLQSTVPTFFGPVIGIDQVNHCVEAVARAKPEEPGDAFPGTAIVALNCIEDRTFDAYGTGVLHVEDGGIYVNSNDPDDALYSGGTSQVWSPSYTVVGEDNGGNFYNEDGSGPGVITSGVFPYPCPSTISYNIPACTNQSQKNGDYTFGLLDDKTGLVEDITIPRITPGILKGQDIKKGAFFEPGIYCITSDIKLVSDYVLKGDGVLLYFMNQATMDIGADGTIQFTPYVDLPPTKLGSLNNLLVYAPITNNATFKWNGNSQSYFTGSIVTPGSLFMLNGTGFEGGTLTQIIADMVGWGGTSDGFIIYDDNAISHPTLPAEIELVR